MVAHLRVGIGGRHWTTGIDPEAVARALLRRRAEGGGSSPDGESVGARVDGDPETESVSARAAGDGDVDASTAESEADQQTGGDDERGADDHDSSDDHRALIDRLRRAEALLEEAERRRSADEYDAAIDAAETARKTFVDARDRAASIPNTKHLVIRETRGDAIADRIAAVETILADLRAKRDPYRRTETILTAVADQRATARTAVGTEAIRTALTVTTDALETIAVVSRYADRHDLGQSDRIDELRADIVETRELAREATGHDAPLAVRPPSIMPRAPSLSLDPDRIDPEATVGSSPFAVVDRAAAGHTDRTVALDRFHDWVADPTDAVADWERIHDHDHVARLIDFGADPEPWLAREYMDGGRIDERAGTLPTDQALWVGAQIADAVWHAHRNDVIHGCLTPSTVRLRSVEEAWDVPRVSHWGVGQRVHTDDAVVAVPQTAAPEQLDGGMAVADERTDVFQLGVVLYELITGTPAYSDDHRVGAPRDVPAPDPPTDVVAVPDAVDDIFDRALALDPGDRYERTLFFRDDLRDLYEAT